MWAKRIALGLLLLCVAGSAAGALGQQGSDSGEKELVLEQGVSDYKGTRDTTIYEENNNTNGAGHHFFAGLTNQDRERRALIIFDLSLIPAESKIISVRLELTVSRTIDVRPADIRLHKLLKSWGEGEKDAGGQEGKGIAPGDGDATWRSNFFGQSFWDSPGGDFNKEPSASTSAGKTDERAVWEGSGLIADVQEWVNDPKKNFGWILLSESMSHRFHSANGNAPAGSKPRLIIRYTPPKS